MRVDDQEDSPSATPFLDSVKNTGRRGVKPLNVVNHNHQASLVGYRIKQIKKRPTDVLKPDL